MNKQVAKVEAGEAAPMLPVDPMVSMIERVAMDPNADLDKLERMLAMKERLEAKEAEKAFAVAFAQMQSDLPVIAERGEIKNRNGDVQSTYPLWEDVNAALRGPLSDHGLSMSFDRRKEDGKTFIGCIVTHDLGHSRRAEIDLPRDTSGSKNDVQGEGSTVAYGQRYSSKMLINWVSAGTEDDDGAASGARDTISADQYIVLRDALEVSGMEERKFYMAFGHRDPDNADLHVFPANRFDEAIARLKKYTEAKANA